MKRNFASLGVVVAVVALLAAACTSSSEGAQPAEATPQPTEVETAPTATAEPEADPTATATPAPPEVTDEQRTEAALAQLESEVAGGEGPEDIIAFDLLDSRVDDDGNIFLRICSWTGETVFDQVRESHYRTAVDDDGTITAQHVTTPVAQGDCVNTQLIETAFDFIDEFEEFRTDYTADPSIFETDPRAEDLLLDTTAARVGAQVDGWLEDGLVIEPSRLSEVRSSTEAPVLYRAYRNENELPILEVVVCAEMNSDYGIYRDGVLIDDDKNGNEGPHAIDLYQLVADPESELKFRSFGGQLLVWSDCSGADYVDAANIWAPLETQLQVLGQ